MSATKQNETTNQTTKLIPVTLDIDELPEDLYDLLLTEFRIQHGSKGTYTGWKITATKEVEENG